MNLEANLLVSFLPLSILYVLNDMELNDFEIYRCWKTIIYENSKIKWIYKSKMGSKKNDERSIDSLKRTRTYKTIVLGKFHIIWWA